MKLKIILIMGVVSALLLGGIGGGYYYVNANKINYLKAESRGLQELLTSLISTQGYLGDAFQELDSPVASTQNLTLDLEMEDVNKDAQIMAGILNGSNLKIESYQDVQNNLSYIQAKILPNGATPIVLEAFSDKEKSGYGIPTFFNQYFYVNRPDQEKVKAELNVSLPSGNLNSKDLISALTVSRPEVEAIGKKYAKLYAESISSKQIKVKDNSEGKEYTVSLDDKQGEQLLEKIANQLKSDDQLVDLLTKRYDQVAEFYNNAGYILEASQTGEPIKEGIVHLADTLIKDKDKKDNSLKMVVTVDEKGHILRRNIFLDNTPGNTDYVKFINKSDGNIKDLQVILKRNDDATSTSEEVKLSYSSKLEDGMKKGTMILAMNGGTGYQINNGLEIIFNFTAAVKENTELFDSTILVLAKENGIPNNLNGALKYELEKLDDKTSAFNYSVKVDFSGENVVDFNLSLNGKGQNEIGKTLELTMVKESNGVNLGDTSQEELVKIEEQMVRGFTNYLMSNPGLQQMVMESLIP